MLDQNTDRMWYVIGAVLIGAAIILIANGSIPQMFASVTESFENVLAEPIAAIDALHEPEELLNPDTETPYSILYTSNGHNTGIGTDEHQTGGTINPVQVDYNHSTSAVIPVDAGTRIHLTKEFAEDVVDVGQYSQYWRLTFMDDEQQYHSRWVSGTNDWELTIPEGAYYFRVSYPASSQPSITVVQ